jgi:hypothetical protein
MRIENNLLLRNLDGLAGAALTGTSQLGSGFYSLRVIGNPLLPACRAEELGKQVLDAGYPAASITVSMNGPACPGP